MALRGAYLTMRRRANALLDPLGATSDQFVLLTILAEEDGLTQQILVRRSFSDPNTITPMLKLLEAKRLVERRPHPRDGRARCVFLTPEGRALQTQMTEHIASLTHRLLRSGKAGQRQAILAWLAQVRESFQS